MLSLVRTLRRLRPGMTFEQVTMYMLLLPPPQFSYTLLTRFNPHWIDVQQCYHSLKHVTSTALVSTAQQLLQWELHVQSMRICTCVTRMHTLTHHMSLLPVFEMVVQLYAWTGHLEYLHC